MDDSTQESSPELPALTGDEALALPEIMPPTGLPAAMSSATQRLSGDDNTLAGRDMIETSITRIDSRVDVRLEAGTGEAMAAMIQQIRPPTLFTLPPAPPSFTGRADERATLERLADERLAGRRGALISGLRGMGGIGKTALALEVAHRLAGRYPDAALYLDLRGTPDPLGSPTAAPMSVQEAQARLIQAFNPVAQVPDDEQALAGLYRSTLHGKRGVLLDDAHDAAQVAPLLPPSPWAVLVTSRQRFPLDGLEPIELDRLDTVEARGLLQRLAGRLADVEADDIATLCGGLPLALQL